MYSTAKEIASTIAYAFFEDLIDYYFRNEDFEPDINQYPDDLINRINDMIAEYENYSHISIDEALRILDQYEDHLCTDTGVWGGSDDSREHVRGQAYYTLKNAARHWIGELLKAIDKINFQDPSSDPDSPKFVSWEDTPDNRAGLLEEIKITCNILG